MKAAQLILILCLALPWAAPASAGVADDADAYVKGEVAKRLIPGLAVAVVHRGEVVLARGYGMANLEWSAPATPDTVFGLASVSKQFTATAIMLLARDGELSVDDPIAGKLDGLPKAWAGITVRHLLGHTSGIKEYLRAKNLSLRQDYAEADLIRMVADEPLEFPPGTRWAYSNTNYVLLGMIVAKAGETSLAAFCRDRIFEPLGMKSTRVNDPRAIIPRRAAGYERSWGVLRLSEWISPSLAATGDGAVVSTALDLAKWEAALDGDRLLPRATLREMWTPGRLADGKPTGYGFGWVIGERRGRPVLEHAGGFPGTSAYIGRFPDEKLSVIVLSNIANAGAAQIGRGIAALYAPSLAAPAPPPPDAKADPAITARHRAALVAWRDGTLDPGLFTPEAKEALFPGPIGDVRKQLAGLGPLGSFAPLGMKEADGLRSHRYRATLGEADLILTIGETPDGQIASIRIVPE
ncbi:serine hydrolase domain-containing protein [Tundrisphaera sp. TA3]|uniref:serine hydrolase domain-containing protein n=1 Tax=Tundrisphaera sp. TA3 TaxID=3435775 RepID=UPI003EBE87D2